MKMQAPANFNSKLWWNLVASQLRDLSDNENCSPLESARHLREWAASRSDSPSFAVEVLAAREKAALVVAANKPRAV